MYGRGDVVRSVDPFKLGEAAERYWLILSDDDHPFADEQYIAVAITTSPHEPGLSIPHEAWEDDGLPRTSYVSPWALHSPRVEDITDRVAMLSSDFCESVLEASREYLS